jgi:site-specific recombinase XerD
MASVEACIRAYIQVHLRAEGRSPATLEWHTHVLGRFATWLREEGHPLDPAEWSSLLIKTYLVSLADARSKRVTPYAPHSIRSMYSSLRSFCRWLHAEGLTSVDVTHRVAEPKTPQLQKPTFSADEIKRIVKVAHASGRNGLRDEAIVLFLLDTGARASEVVGLTVDDLDWDTLTALVRGKGGKDRRIPFSATTAKVLQRYALKERDDGCPNFFQSEDGQPLTRWGLGQLCQRLGDRAHVAVNPHKFRHTFAITYLRAGGSVFALQKTLGHSSLDMSLRYSHMLTDDLVREHIEHSPVSFLLKGRGTR